MPEVSVVKEEERKSARLAASVRAKEAADCFVTGPEGHLHGPLRVNQARALIETLPLGAGLLRSCQLPVRLEDEQGVRLVLESPSISSDGRPPPPLMRPDIFNPQFEFSCVATAHYADQRRWFRKRQRRRRAADAQRMEERRFHQAVRLHHAEIPIQMRLRSLALRAGVLLTVAFLVFSPHMLQEDVPLGYPSLRALDGQTLRARSPASLNQLARAVSAKISGDSSTFSEQLLKLLPHHRVFQDSLLPPPIVVVSWALSSLDHSELDTWPVWRPLLALLHRNEASGLAGLAYFSREARRLFEQTVELARRRSVQGRALAPGSAARVYWGLAGADSLAQRLLSDVELRFREILGRFERAIHVPKTHRSMEHYFLARTLWVAHLFYGGVRGRFEPDQGVSEQLGRLSEQLGFPDREIIGTLLDESQSIVGDDLASILKRRLALARRLHEESGFLCEPGRSVLGIEFLLQTARLAVASGASLPPLRKLFQNCLVRPSRLLPTGADLSDSEALLAFLPQQPDGYSLEWQLAVGKDGSQPGWLMRTLRGWPFGVSSSFKSGPTGLSFDPRIQWLTYLALITGEQQAVRELILAVGPECSKRVEGVGNPICWRLRWESMGFELQEGASLRLYLEEAARRYALADVQELYFQRLLQHYRGVMQRDMSFQLGQKVRMDPVVFARTHGVERFLDLNRAHLNSLEWYARHAFP